MPLDRTLWDHRSIATDAHEEPDPLTATKLLAPAGMGIMLASRTAVPAPSRAAARARHLGLMTSSSIRTGVVPYGSTRRRPGAAGAAWRRPRRGRRRPARTRPPRARAPRRTATPR